MAGLEVSIMAGFDPSIEANHSAGRIDGRQSLCGTRVCCFSADMERAYGSVLLRV